MDEQADRSDSAPLLHGGSSYFGTSPTSRKRRHSYEVLPALQAGSRSATLRPRRHSSCDEPVFGLGLAKRSRQEDDQGLTSILEDRECGTEQLSLNIRGNEMARGQTDSRSPPAQEQREFPLLGTDNLLEISKQGDPGSSSTGRHILTPRRRKYGLVHYDSPLEVAVSNPAIRDGDGSIPRSRVAVQNEVLNAQPQPPPAAARRRRFGVVTAPVQFAGARTLGELLSVCNKDDFTEWELRKIAAEISLDATPQLASLLGANIEEISNAEYGYMQHPTNQAIDVLKFWHSTVSGEGAQKRRRIVERLYDMNKLKLAEMVATKSYI